MYRYFMLLGLNVPLSAGVLGLLLLVIDHPVIAKFLSDIAILTLNFWLSKTWVFPADSDIYAINSALVEVPGHGRLTVAEVRVLAHPARAKYFAGTHFQQAAFKKICHDFLLLITS